MVTVSSQPATLDDFFRAEKAAPVGSRLALIDGEIVEWGANMTTRGPVHSRAVSRLSYLLWEWMRANPDVVGGVDAGEVRCRIARAPDRIVGIDLGVWVGEEFREPPVVPPFYDAPPRLAVEVMSPSDRNEDLWEKIRVYLDARVTRVWIVDPELKTVTVHRPDAEPTLYNVKQAISNDPALPGLTLAIGRIFLAD